MRRALHEAGVPRASCLELRQMLQELSIDGEGGGVPAAIGDEAAMEDVKPAQVLDLEMAGKTIAQLARGEEMEIHRHATPIIELDLAPVALMIELEMSRLLDRVDEDRRRAADRAHGGDEMPLGDAPELGGDARTVHSFYMTENAVEA